MSELWQRIRQARKDAGISQEKVGMACNPQVSKAAVGLWETSNASKRTQPRYSNLEMIARVTNKSISWLLTGESETIVSSDELSTYTTETYKIKESGLVSLEGLDPDVQKIIIDLVRTLQKAS